MTVLREVTAKPVPPVRTSDFSLLQASVLADNHQVIKEKETQKDGLKRYIM